MASLSFPSLSFPLLPLLSFSRPRVAALRPLMPAVPAQPSPAPSRPTRMPVNSTVGALLLPNRRRVKAPKALVAADCQRLEQLPNIGPAMAADLRALGIHHPRDLTHRDAFGLYQALCAHSGKRQDPCVLDTFMAATDFMRGAAPAPWWAYTAQRKLLHGEV
jgi:hypothetical protein